MNAEFDFAIIGGGSAGYAAARTAASLGLRAAVIDGAKELGGLCILRGCMPSKALIESANRALTIRRAAEFGLQATLGGVDPVFIRDRKRALIGEFAHYRQEQLASGKFTLLRGSAKFLDPHRLELTSSDAEGERSVITARTILIASGSGVSVPDLPGLEEAGYWTSDDVLDAASIPESCVVLGGGAIALELAHYLDGVGCRVSVIQRSPHLLRGMDPDVGNAVQAAFQHRGIDVRVDTRLLRVERVPGGKRVIYLRGGREESLEASEILVALGRHPSTANLALDAAAVERDGSRVLTDRHQRTSQAHIFAAGDVCGPLEVVHLAIQQGETAAKAAAALLLGAPAPPEMDYRLRLFGVFTHPQAAAVGLSEKEAAEAKRPVLVAKHSFHDHGKSMVAGETDGFVKLIADPSTGEILGASVVGPEATELIHEIVVAMHFRATAAQLATIPHYHPTLSEIWTYPAEEIAEQAAVSR